MSFCGRALLLSCLLPLTATLNAQQQPATQPATRPTSVDLHVVVTPKTGLPVADLQKSDFTVLDNKTPQTLTSFHAVSPQDPVRVTVVIDEVNVTYENIAYQRGQIEKFLHANGGQLSRPTQLAFFTDHGIQVQEGYTTNGNELYTSLDQHAVGLRDIRRSSQFELSDRLNLSLTALRSLAAHEAELPGRKMILWISPGWPLLSGPGIELDAKQQDQIFASVVALLNGMREARITLYDVNPIGVAEGVLRANYFENFLNGVTKESQVNLGDLSLQVIAAQSGGLNLYGSNNLPGMLKQCMEDATASYTLSFPLKPAEHANEYHRIEVKVNKPGLTARTTAGYYAQP